MAFEAQSFDLGNAGRTVAAQDKSENLGDRVVVLFAQHGVAEFLAFGAGRLPLLLVACAYLAPACLDILATSRAFAIPIGTAGTTVQSAGCDQFEIGNYCHRRLHNFPKIHSNYPQLNNFPTQSSNSTLVMLLVLYIFRHTNTPAIPTAFETKMLFSMFD